MTSLPAEYSYRTLGHRILRQVAWYELAISNSKWQFRTENLSVGMYPTKFLCWLILKYKIKLALRKVANTQHSLALSPAVFIAFANVASRKSYLYFIDIMRIAENRNSRLHLEQHPARSPVALLVRPKSLVAILRCCWLADETTFLKKWEATSYRKCQCPRSKNWTMTYRYSGNIERTTRPTRLLASD